MITKQKTLFYFVGDEAFKSLEEAQVCDLRKIVDDQLRTCPVNNDEFPEVIARWLLKNKVAIMDILSTTPRSRARARKANGATRKPRTPRTTATPTTP